MTGAATSRVLDKTRPGEDHAPLRFDLGQRYLLSLCRRMRHLRRSGQIQRARPTQSLLRQPAPEMTVFSRGKGARSAARSRRMDSRENGMSSRGYSSLLPYSRSVCRTRSRPMTSPPGLRYLHGFKPTASPRMRRRLCYPPPPLALGPPDGISRCQGARQLRDFARPPPARRGRLGGHRSEPVPRRHHGW